MTPDGRFSPLRGVDEQGRFGQSYPQPALATFTNKKAIANHYNNIQAMKINPFKIREEADLQGDYFFNGPSLEETNDEND